MSRLIRPLVLCLSALIASSCAARLHCPKQGGSAWRAVETSHFELKTNLSEKEARALAKKLENSYLQLQFWVSRWLPINDPEHDLVEVIHFASTEELQRFTGDPIGGFVSKVHGSVLTVTSEGARRSDQIEILQHELTHRLMSDYLGRLPQWIAEGAAEFFSTVELRDEETVAGQLPSRASYTWFYGPSGVPSLETMRRLSGSEFYEGKNVGKRYYGAWRAVHYFATKSKKLQAGFSAYVQLLAKGVAEDEAWQEVFGNSQPTLDQGIRRHEGQKRVPMLALPRPAFGKIEVVSRLLGEGEIHSLFARVLSRRFPKPSKKDWARGIEKIRRELGLSVEHDPAFEDIAYWELALLGRELAREGALDRLRGYVQERPDNAMGLRLLLSQEMILLEEREDRVRKLAALNRLASALARVATTSVQLNEAAWYYSKVDEPTKGLGLAQRAVGLEPLCAECFDTFALLLYQDGQKALARIMQERAVGLYREMGHVPLDVAERLKQFQKESPALPNSGA